MSDQTHQHQDRHPGHHHHDPAGPDEVRFTEEFWEERYRSRPTIWSGQPNRHLVAQAADIGLDEHQDAAAEAPSSAARGLALDVGCGEGADAVWLAEQGWRVLAVDWSATALERGAAHAATAGSEVAERIVWEAHDLTSWDPGAGRFDLVSSQFVHLPPEDWEALFTRMAASVRVGGTLLVCAHHPSDLQTTMPRPNQPGLFYTGDQLAAQLEAGSFEIVTNDAPGREVEDPDGRMITIRDTVFRARRVR